MRHLMIPGAMRCGTSTLFQVLKDHPQVCASKLKEPEFFSQKQSHGWSDRISGVTSYTDLFQPQPWHKALLDASTGYGKEPEVPARIASYGLDPACIFILRNPFERIISHANFVQKWHSGFIDYAISLSDYWSMIKRFDQFDVHVLTLDELLSDTDNTIARLLEFAGLAPWAPPELPHANQGKRTEFELLHAEVHDRLQAGMHLLANAYGVNVADWGF